MAESVEDLFPAEASPEAETPAKSDEAPGAPPSPEAPEKKEAPPEAPAKEETKTVPLAALIEEREKFRTKISELEERLTKYDKLEDRLNQFYAEKEKQTEPSYEEDPAGYLRWQQQQLDKRYQDLAARQAEQDNTLKQQQQLQQVLTRVQAHEQKFAQDHPDYYEALQFVRQKESDRMRIFGYSDEQILQALNASELQAAMDLLARERNPAEVIYQTAKFYGYQPQEKAPGNSSPPPADEEKLQKLEQGLQASKSLGSGGTTTLQDMERMPLSEFEQAMKEMFGR